MIKKSLKYFAIAAINVVVLTTLLFLWNDKLELDVGDFVMPIEFLKILGLTFLSLVVMRVLITYFRDNKPLETKTKTKIFIYLTLLVSSYLYIGYAVKVVNNCIINRQFRKQISAKIKPANRLACGTRADSLTYAEYHQITKMTWFPQIPVQAKNINYIYGYDGFLPDYTFTLTYDLPKEMKADTMTYTKSDFSQQQTVEIISDIKRVTYTENER